MKKRSRVKLELLFISFLMLVSIGYAAINTTLSISGTTAIKGDTENFINNVFFQRASISSSYISLDDIAFAQPKINGNVLTFAIPKTAPFKDVEDTIELFYTIRNESNYNAQIGLPILETSDDSLLNYFNITHTVKEEYIIGPNSNGPEHKLTLTLKRTYSEQEPKVYTFKVKINSTATDALTTGSGGNNGVQAVLIEKINGDGTNVGDEVAIDDQAFYVISNNGKYAALMSKYNILVGNTFDGTNTNPIASQTGIQDKTAIGAYVDSLNNPKYPWIGTIQYANTNYWKDKNLNYPANVYDENSNLKAFIDNYKIYLSNKGISIIDARPIKSEELAALGCDFVSHTCTNAPKWVYKTSYWTSTANGDNLMMSVISDGNYRANNYNLNNSIGVRPVIEIPSSLI